MLGVGKPCLVDYLKWMKLPPGWFEGPKDKIILDLGAGPGRALVGQVQRSSKTHFSFPFLLQTFPERCCSEPANNQDGRHKEGGRG